MSCSKIPEMSVDVSCQFSLLVINKHLNLTSEHNPPLTNLKSQFKRLI